MMKKLFTQLRNEWRGNFFLALELLVVFVVLWYIVDWCCVTARVSFMTKIFSSASVFAAGRPFGIIMGMAWIPF